MQKYSKKFGKVGVYSNNLTVLTPCMHALKCASLAATSNRTNSQHNEIYLTCPLQTSINTLIYIIIVWNSHSTIVYEHSNDNSKDFEFRSPKTIPQPKTWIHINRFYCHSYCRGLRYLTHSDCVSVKINALATSWLCALIFTNTQSSVC